ncbi:hypothetical protein [Helicobacter pylori]|nr:hypothetical protein [Helicobacter pylori]
MPRILKIWLNARVLQSQVKPLKPYTLNALISLTDFLNHSI